MNANSLAEAKGYLVDAANACERAVPSIELMRFAYYYALARQAREGYAMAVLASHQGGSAEDEEESVAPTTEEDMDFVTAAIQLANRATVIQSRVRGKMARGRAKDQADHLDGYDSRARSLWNFAVREQKQQQVSKLKMEIEMLRRNEVMLNGRWQGEVARLEKENCRLAAENAQLRAASPSVSPSVPSQTQSVEERLEALNWLARTKSSGRANGSS